MRTINGVRYMEESDFWNCKHVKGGTDGDGSVVAVCSLSGLMCEEVLRYADEGCKYEKSEPRENTGRWDKYEEPEFYDQ